VTGFDDLPRLRQPEYTGENRCTPCTVVNLCLAGFLGVALGLSTRPAVGAVAFALGALVVYVRGYLVPGTPALTRRYFPPWLLRAFGKEPVSARTLSATRGASAGDADIRGGDTGDVDDPLVAAGVVAPGDSPDLTAAFREEWQARIGQLGDGGVEADDVAAAFGGESADRHGDTTFVLDGSASLRWGSTAALRADVAAAQLLAARLDGWADHDRDARRSVLMGLRLSLETCPGCGGQVHVDEDRVDPCCEKPHLVADAVCADCGAALADAAVVDDGTTVTVRASLLEI